MRLSAEDLRQIKEMFIETVDEMFAREEFTTKVANLINKEVQSLRDRTNKLEKENCMLKEKLDSLEQYTRRSSLRLHGMPEEKNENIEDKLVKIFQERMGVQILPEYIDRCHRVGPIRAATEARKKTVRPVIVKFTSYKFRESVYRSKAKLKGSNFVVSEDLTSNRYQLLKAARLKFGNRNAWSYDGKIFVSSDGSKTIVESLADLSDSVLTASVLPASVPLAPAPESEQNAANVALN